MSKKISSGAEKAEELTRKNEKTTKTKKSQPAKKSATEVTGKKTAATKTC